MSADNLAKCPQCLAQAHAEHSKAVEKVSALYGVVPVEDFDAEREAIQEVDSGDFYTFREDYEFYGAEDGHIHASYSGHCKVCGLTCEFTAEKVFWTA